VVRNWMNIAQSVKNRCCQKPSRKYMRKEIRTLRGFALCLLMRREAMAREQIIIQLIARDEDMSVEEAADFWARWKAELEKNPEHFGDCTKEPQTCNRCLIESYYRDADQILTIPDLHAEAVKAERKGIVAWGDETCLGHEGYQYSLHRRQCASCWGALEKGDDV